jgi:glycerate kinase
MADGGEGTVDAFLETGARRISATVRGPLDAPVAAAFALDGETAIVEMAAASGLALLAPESRDATRASTFGTGELIRAALDAGARRIVVAVGGSATNDGGAGALAALGAVFRDASGRALEPGGLALAGLAAVDLSGLDPRLDGIDLEVAADVDNPLCGPHGASAVFGPQKGATAAQVAALDAALARLASVVTATLHVAHHDLPGSGAAGGLAYGLRAVLGARVRPGVEIVAELRGLSAALDGAALCYTGEGSIDVQTLRGKTVAGVGRLARAAGVALVAAFGGRVDAEAERALARDGIVALPICDRPLPQAEAFAEAAVLLERAAARATRLAVGAQSSNE